MALTEAIAGASSDTYATLVEYQARATAMGWTLSGVAATDEVHMRRAAVALDALWTFVGYRQYEAQARDWPRVTHAVVDGWSVAVDTVPQAIKDAQCELAYLIHGGADPTATIEGVVKRKRVKGGPAETETEYLGGKGRARYTAVEALLRPYLAVGVGQLRLVRG